MKRTTNYALPTWEKSDFIQMSDFNDLTQKTDAALKANADAAGGKAVVWKDAGISWYNATATNANQQLNNDESYCYVVLGYDKVKENS